MPTPCPCCYPIDPPSSHPLPSACWAQDVSTGKPLPPLDLASAIVKSPLYTAPWGEPDAAAEPFDKLMVDGNPFARG